MENQLYNIFEGDQVLTAKNLNDLRTYLDAQDRLSRTHLSGIGIVCGLEVKTPDVNTIEITEGVGVTSRGYLANFPGASCTYIRSYTDPGTIEPAPGEAEAGVYPTFKDGDEGQIKLWELIEINEEDGEGAAPDMFEINQGEAGTVINEGTGETINFSNYCVMLYLEMNDEDLEDCFGDDCDENGIQRNFIWRKLLIHKADLDDIIDELPAESKYIDALGIGQSLDDPYVERLGFYEDENLSLVNYTSYKELYNDYDKVIEEASVRVGKVLYKSYESFKPLLAGAYASHPFPDFNNNSETENGLFKRIREEVQFKPAAIQYAYDFLKDLVDAYDEFREAACEVVAVCRPNPILFPRHLILDYLGIAQNENKRSAYRHYFQPSPILDGHRNLKKEVRHLHKRMVNMVEQFKVDIEENEIRITPSKTAADLLSSRSIPYYYNVDEVTTLLRLWNYRKTLLNKFELIPSYHAGEYAGRSQVQSAMHNYNRHPFLRIEGHIGRSYERVLGELQGLQNQINVPMKIVGVKLSETFSNTKVSYECRFEDLQELYETFKTEFNCLLDEQMKFFRGLEVKKDTADEEGSTGVSGIGLANMGEEFWAGTEITEYYSEEIDTYYSPITGERRYPKESNPNTFGYIYDNLAARKTGNQQILDLALNIDPTVFNIDPKVWIYLFLKPAQLANNIQNLLKLLPKRLEDIDLNEIAAAYDRVIQTAKEYKKQLKESEENQEQLQGKEQVIIYRLDKLIYSCSIKKLKELYRIYRDRIEKAQQMNLFSNFAKRHSGMEHMAGVPKGGTFVLVYIDRNEEPLDRDVQIEASATSATAEANIRDWERIRKKQQLTFGDKKEIDNQVKILLKELRYVSEEQGIGIDAEKWEELDRGMMDKIRVQPEAEVDERPPDNVVVADFALPYLCQSDCPELATMIISQLSFSLPKFQFCKKDETKYPFTVHPEGGVVESNAGGVVQEGGQWFFIPSEVTTQGENIQFTYRVNNQTVVYNAKIFNPQAFFTFETKQLENGNVEVTFFNSSKGADYFEWDFGDGTNATSQEPVHIYQDYEEEQAIVTLKARRGDCKDQISKGVQIPQEVETEFDLQRSKVFDKYTYCNTDPVTYPFIRNPQGAELTGDDISGIQKQNDRYFFAPEGYQPGSYVFKYRDKSIEVTILQGPQNVDFETEVLDQKPNSTTMSFHYTGESEAENLVWIIDGESYDVPSPERTFPKRDINTYQITLYVESENRCRKRISETIEVPFKEDDSDDSDPIIIEIDDGIRRVDHLRNPALDNILFDGGNVILNESRNYLTTLNAKLQDKENRLSFKAGEMNLEIANNYEPILENASNIIKTKADETSEDEKHYLSGLYEQQLNQLLKLISNQEKDIRSNSKMGQLLKAAKEQIKDMREMGVEVDKKKILYKSVEKAKAEAENSGKGHLVGLLQDLKEVLKK